MPQSHVLILGLTLIVAATAKAQEPAQPGRIPATQPAPPVTKRIDNRELGDGLTPGRRSFFMLLKNPAIVEELELTDEQELNLKDAETKQQEFFSSYAKEHQQKMLEAQERDKQRDLVDPPQTNREKIERLNNRETGALGQAYTETLNRVMDETDASISRKILDRKQARRLREIQAQAEGPDYFSRPEVQENLALEPDQIAEIKKIAMTHRSQFRAAAVVPSNVTKPAANAGDSPEAKIYAGALETTRNSVMKLRVSTMKAIEQVLSKPQRGRYKTLIGEPFMFYRPKDEKSAKDPVNSTK